jgi:O-antigen/teichoic acid export membrane protein
MAGLTWAETALRIAYLIAMTRLLGAEQYGLWTYAISVIALFYAITTFGFEQIVLYAYGGAREDGDRTVETALALRVGICLLAVPVLIVFALTGAAEESRAGLLIVAPVVLGRGLAELVRAIFVARQDTRRIAPVVLAFRAGEVIAGTGLILAGAGIPALLALHCAAWTGEAAATARRLRRDFGIRFRRPEPAALLAIWPRALPLAVNVITAAYLMSAPILLHGWVKPDFAAIGQLAIALQITVVLVVLLDAFMVAAIPVVAHGHARGDARLAWYAALVAFGVLAAVAVLAVLTHFLVPPLLALLLGPGYEPAARLAVPATLLVGFISFPVGAQQLLFVRQRYWPVAWANLAAGAVMTAGFALAGARLAPDVAIWIAAGAWGLRGAIILSVFWISGAGRPAPGG